MSGEDICIAETEQQTNEPPADCAFETDLSHVYVVDVDMQTAEKDLAGQNERPQQANTRDEDHQRQNIAAADESIEGRGRDGAVCMGGDASILPVEELTTEVPECGPNRTKR
jgi:hypothetical protein